MASRYLMQVIDRQTGEVVQFEPGRAIEAGFVDACVALSVRRDVGFGRTTRQVARAIRLGVEEAIEHLKLRVKP